MAWPLGYTLLPGLPGGTGTYAYGVSGDGLVVVGEADDSAFNSHAVYWTDDTAPIDLGFLPGGGWAFAVAANFDGSVIVGTAEDATSHNNAFIWTEADGMVSLGLPLGANHTRALSVSADGLTVVGFLDPAPNGDRAFRWTSAGGFVVLPTRTPSDPTISAGAYDISADGAVVVGHGDSSGEPYFAVQWPNATTIELLDFGSATGGTAFSANNDGTVIVGSVVSGNNRAVLWNASGLVDIGVLPGGSYSSANDVTGDGSLVVGTGDNNAGTQVPWTWTLADGMVPLDLPVGISPTDSSDCNSVAADGSVVVGDVPITQAGTPGNGQNPAHYVPTFLGGGGNAYEVMPRRTVFTSQLTTGVISYWLHTSSFWHTNQWGFNVDFNDIILDPATYYEFSFGLDNGKTFDLACIRQNSPGTGIVFAGGATGAWPADDVCAVHVLVSFDFTPGTRRLQVYVNDVTWTTSGPTGDGIPAPTFTVGNTEINATAGNYYNEEINYVADLWVGSTASFVDLTNATNRRKFINADLSPVDLGANGQNPFGTAPQLYKTIPNGGVIADWFANKGTAGGTFASAGAGQIRADGDPCAVPGQPLYTAFAYGLTPLGPPPPSGPYRPAFSAIFYPQPGKRR